MPSISEPASEKLFGVACLQPGERVLDVACGTGVVTRAAAAIVGPTGYVVGLDINPGMLATARRHAPPGCSIEWCEASAESIPFPDASFNVALCQMGLQFVPDKRAALGEMHRVLIDGGRLVANVPGPMPEVFSILTDGLARRIGDRAAAFVGAVFSLHDAAQLHALLGDAGFRDVKVDSALTRLEVPEPRDFLWQYIASTPMAEFVMRADAESRVALEHEVTDRWRQFRTDGGMKLEVRMTTATASA
ncbi:MAG TPA: methyltransferase domain-containing protein [Vitreimonas sp.]|nr:methyltransferase domain-containing protein [Vitreimonas sp.]